MERGPVAGYSGSALPEPLPKAPTNPGPGSTSPVAFTLDDDLLRAVKARAARTGQSDREVIDEALRRGLGLGLFDRWDESNELSETEAVALAVESQHATRPHTR